MKNAKLELLKKISKYSKEDIIEALGRQCQADFIIRGILNDLEYIASKRVFDDYDKARFVKETVNFGATVVFAETRDKAKSLALCTSCCKDANICDIEVRRVPQMDKYYVEGKTEMDWFNPKDRIALVKECGFYCEDPIAECCESCPAKEFCDEAVQEKEHPNDR